ncbi:phage holin family protein [Cellulomonas sp. PhB143]|uniref:phage holin family protein n=1 Tax=Cellulomonas sp. PhB143 TaxID=2485186 RepID=UPI000F47312B|nr:phage holin family protein [Cellulomonas sp. PhB143]ROS79072.1 putative membrane protein [Cellulomonas sp. PhB143]
MNFLVRALIMGLTFWFASLIFDDHFFIVDNGTVLGEIVVIVVVAALFTLVNMVVKPILQIISIPLYILTLGLFHLVINALMLMLTAWLTEATDWGIRLEGGFWWAVWIALIIAVINALITGIVPGRQTR